MSRFAAHGEIGRRCGGGEALHPRADRHGDHVLLEPLLVADPRVAAAGEHVDEAFLDDDLQANVRISFQERRHDRRKDEACGAAWHVELERPGRPVAKGVDDVHRRLDLAQRGDQALQQAGAGFGR